MNIRIISDLHLEFGYGQMAILDTMPEEDKQVLVIAGDLGVATYADAYISFLIDVSSRFKHVIYIMGNHEHYNNSFLMTKSIIQSNLNWAGIADKVSILEKECIDIDDVSFVCATLWTDMDKENPISMYQIPDYMNDYHKIKTGVEGDEYMHRLRAKDTIADHKQAKEFIFSECQRVKNENRKLVVVTHHAPSRLSISDGFENSDINGAFVSDLSNEMLDLDYPMIWIHGHVHQSHNYQLGKVEVICNPYGYGTENTLEFDSFLVKEV